MKDLREIREKIEAARKKKAVEDAKTENDRKTGIISDVIGKRKKDQDTAAKEQKASVRIARAFSFMKAAGVAVLLTAAAFAIHAGLIRKDDALKNVRIIQAEEPACEEEASAAIKSSGEILEALSKNGTGILNNYWSKRADGEARFNGESILGTLNPSEFKFCAVKRIPGMSALKVEGRWKRHPVSLILDSSSDELLLISVE